METIKYIFRILTAPFVFFISAVAMILFPGTIAFMLGIGQLIQKALTPKPLRNHAWDDSYRDILMFTTIGFWWPCLNTYKWVTEGKFDD